MTIPNVIYAPALYWFSYQHHDGLVMGDADQSSLEDIDIDWVQKQYDKILSKFDLKLNLPLREDEPAPQFDLLNSTIAKFKPPSLNLEGFVYPQSIHDAYALNLNVYYPEDYEQDALELKDLKTLNPQNCFMPDEERVGYLGQTLLLSTYLSSPPPENLYDLKDLAQQCWLAFFGLENSEQLPRLYRASRWFGGYLYEYGNPKASLQENPYGRLLIWFLWDESPTLILKEVYWDLPELFLYTHKVTTTFQESRLSYQRADDIIKGNEQQLERFNIDYLQRESTARFSDDELKGLKSMLKGLLKTSLYYSKALRNLEYYQNTIAINTKNYQRLIEFLEGEAQADLAGFRRFGEKEAINFQQQIEADLNYFRQGSGLLDKTIATLRGLVEIDQAESEKLRAKEERKAEQKLQDQIQAIGLGIATGSILASSFGLITQPITWPWQPNHGKYPHPFLVAAIVSLCVAWMVWQYMKRKLAKEREKS